VPETAEAIRQVTMQTAPRLAPPTHKVHARVGPYSQHGAVSLIDGRSREAQLMKRVRAELVAHVGGNPGAVQRQLIERACRLTLQLEFMDERIMHGEALGPAQHNHYLAWSNALTRTLARLGVKPAAAAKPSIAEASLKAALEAVRATRAGPAP
jgi:hypothetical protein